MDEPADRRPSRAALLRVALGVFVLAWIFGPYELRSAVPVWLVFLIALGLEVQLFLGALRAEPRAARDRGPQAVDRERFGYPEEVEDPFEVELDEEYEPEPAELVPARRPLWPPLRRLLVGAGLIGAFALVLWFVEARTGWDALSAETKSQAEARFSAEASRIAGKPVTVRCDESGRRVGIIQHADGAAVVGGDLAFLTPQRCLDLYRLAFEGEERGSRTGRALAVLAHEAWHLRGVRDEGQTECNALRSGVELGRRLGLSLDTARELMSQQRAENPLHAAESPEYLLPPDC
ncbi:MAG: hypothetical protein WD249_08900 [Gaiellaceae bacterium]